MAMDKNGKNKSGNRRGVGGFQKGNDLGSKWEDGNIPWAKTNKGYKQKCTVKKERMFMDNPKKTGESIHDYLLRLVEGGHMTYENSPTLVGKLLDKEVGNAPTVQLTAELKDSMSEEELDLLFEQAGVSRTDKDDSKPTKH